MEYKSLIEAFNAEPITVTELSELATEFQSHLKSKVLSMKQPPLKDETIRRKSSAGSTAPSTPVFEFGQFYESVRYRVALNGIKVGWDDSYHHRTKGHGGNTVLTMAALAYVNDSGSRAAGVPKREFVLESECTPIIMNWLEEVVNRRSY